MVPLLISMPVLRAADVWRRVRRLIRVAAVVAVTLSVPGGLLALVQLHHVYINRTDLPDLGPLIRFELPTIGRVYDSRGGTLSELAREYREIAQYDEIPPILRDAILAAEDKRFFSHDGIDYVSLARVARKARLWTLVGRLGSGGDQNQRDAPAVFPQGGSTITQQLVRGTFLKLVTQQENSYQSRHGGVVAAVLSPVIGTRTVNMLARKREEMRLSFWLEQEMRRHYGSKRRAKEEILARYAALVYMGNGQYGFARAAEYYFDRPMASLTNDDADIAAVLAGIAKSPRDYAPGPNNGARVLRRRDQTLALMVDNGSITAAARRRARARLRAPVVRDPRELTGAASVVEHVLADLHRDYHGLMIEDLLQGRIQVSTTVDARVQRISDDALEHGLQRYERRHPKWRGAIQGAVVVLRNRDGSVLAETGGRHEFNGRLAAYSDFNRARRSLRQPGSAMKPMVYLAAFVNGAFTLDSLVPDEPISVFDGHSRPRKSIANYDGRFKGPIPLRQALAESRNAVAIWMAGRVGIEGMLGMSRAVGVQTPLARFLTTALGASEVNLIELGNAYRTMASGIIAEPYVIRAVVDRDGTAVVSGARRPASPAINPAALALVQEGLRGVVRLPSGTAHALASLSIAVMGKTGTTNDFRDAIFVGSTYGPDGITAAVRIGFDDNRSLGSRETGGRVALPVFRELIVAIYRDNLVGKAPKFPADMEARITAGAAGIALANAIVALPIGVVPRP